MATALNFTDFLYRPRRSKLDTGRRRRSVRLAAQVDVVRLRGHAKAATR